MGEDEEGVLVFTSVVGAGVGRGRGETEDADRDGPSLDATSADLSKKLLYSYFDRIYCSRSLSRSASIKFGGGGCRISFGLKIALDLTFPICFMVSVCSFVQESIVRLFTFVICVPILR